MNALFAAAAGIEAFCATRRWRCCVIDGLAVQRWGEPRQTRDVDLTLLTGIGGEAPFVDAILLQYAPRIPEGPSLCPGTACLARETADQFSRHFARRVAVRNPVIERPVPLSLHPVSP